MQAPFRPVGSGNDIIRSFASAGVDIIIGGSGNDEIQAGDGVNVIFGDAFDLVPMALALTHPVEAFLTDYWVEKFDVWNDTILQGSGNDTIVGGSFFDLVFAGDGEDKVWGHGGTDILFGGRGRDELYGGSGKDYLHGGDGDDYLEGGEDYDMTRGRAGVDTFTFDSDPEIYKVEKNNGSGLFWWFFGLVADMTDYNAAEDIEFAPSSPSPSAAPAERLDTRRRGADDDLLELGLAFGVDAAIQAHLADAISDEDREDRETDRELERTLLDLSAIELAASAVTVLPQPITVITAVTAPSQTSAQGFSSSSAGVSSITPIIVEAKSELAEHFPFDTLNDIQFPIADLPGDLLGQASGKAITLDIDAAGYGWFIDATPWESSEFDGNGLAIDDRAAGRVDLLTVLLHELDHIHGLEHSDDPDDLMYETLQLGVRRTMSSQLDGLFQEQADEESGLDEELLRLLAEDVR
jgi:hypothetical protein